MKPETKGIVVKEIKLSNDDRLIKILTENMGIITAIIKESRRRKNDRNSLIRMLSYCNFELFEGKNYYIVDNAEVLDIFWSIKDDLKIFAVSQYFCELSMALSPEPSNSQDFLKLLLNSVFYISKKIKDIELVKIIFEMRALTLCGYMPDLVCCCECHKYTSDMMYFLLERSKIVCGDCFRGAEHSAIAVSKGMLDALRHIVYSPIEKLFSFKLSDKAIKTLTDLSEKYVAYHLGTGFKSLEFYNTL